MRFAALATVFMAHAASPFDFGLPYHLKAPERSALLHGLSLFMLSVCIPMFMFVVGWSAAGSLGRSSVRGYLGRRLPKLLLPLAFGLIVFAPVIKFLELKSGINLTISGAGTISFFDEPFTQHFVRFFTRLNRFSWSYLWFLAYLALLSVAFAPLLRRIAMAPACVQVNLTWAFLPVLPIAATEMLLRGWFPDHRNLITDWCSILLYVQFLVAGAMAWRHPGFAAALVRAGPALLLMALLAAIMWASVEAIWLARLLRGLVLWGVVAGLYGVLRDRIAGGPRLDWLATAAFPLYVLHMPIFVAIGFLVIATVPGAVLPAAIIFLTGATLTFAAYVVVRPVRILRPLIGLPALASHRPA